MTDAEIDVEVALWESVQPLWERRDPIWTLLAYRIARFALDSVRADLRSIRGRVPPTVRDQLLRAAASISANIGEGYSRPTGRERARFYSFALGSAREAISWYATLTDELPSGVAMARIALLTRVRRLLLGLVRRTSSLHSPFPPTPPGSSPSIPRLPPFPPPQSPVPHPNPPTPHPLRPE